MISGVHHLAIQVRDLASCERFYRDVLGLSLLRRWPAQEGAGDRSVWLNLGDGSGTFLALETVADEGIEGPSGGAARNAETGGPGLGFFALRIRRDQRPTWEQRLAAADVAIVHRTAYTIYFCDPEGNRLGLSHYPDAHAPDAHAPDAHAPDAHASDAHAPPPWKSG
jgi:glyoxylase I family protein